MRYREWMEFEKILGGRRVFSFRDLTTYFGVTGRANPRSLRVIAHRAVKDGILWRLCKGWYAFADDLPDPEEAAVTIAWPAYVSMERALSLEGVLSQGIHTVTIMTPRAWRSKRSFTLEYPDGTRYPVEVRFLGKAPADLFGKVAPPETALADLLCVRGGIEGRWSYLRQIAGDIYWDEVDLEELFRRLRSHPSGRGGSVLHFLKTLNIPAKATEKRTFPSERHNRTAGTSPSF
ncbi:hypothetical protein [Thermosulfurimonas sp. F29]|uniref:type IV toxin-antitoxin system AbiEi family antitoxin domain-containing protein n=1 Tax=Thermosulfurimonas sp. F29 TaxID=2867247 RepID=UPI001C8370F4|nr:hypothetical protein [Thermosulfurimonas sp. F29]MBX6424168.1 hypothetical protein [Thermosulfurimonas sp. F29]